MTDFLAGRLQMAVSLGFHIIFASIGMTMPFFMFAAESIWLRTNNKMYLQLAKAWSKGVAIFFAVGAVSGTVLSFEFGMLWPSFMKHAGPIFGLPFSWEGTAFFLEAIALGLFLYGWKKLNKWVHLFTGLVVGLAGVLSGIFVISANAWMNAPAGFDWIDGQPVNIDPVKAMFNRAWFSESHHMIIAAFSATGFAVAGIHALLYKRSRMKIHLAALIIAMAFGAVAAIVQPLSGDNAAKNVAKLQPAKLAALESHFKTGKGVPLIIGGIPKVDQDTVVHAIRIPKLLSFLAYKDFNAEVIGLEDFPRDEWPPVVISHFSFQFMVLIGFLMAAIGILFFLIRWKWKGILEKKWWLTLLFILTPLGFIAIELGWTVTEVGRQPWIIYGILKTQDSLTPMPGLWYTFSTVSTIYLILSFIVIWLLSRQIKALQNENVNNGLS